MREIKFRAWHHTGVLSNPVGDMTYNPRFIENEWWVYDKYSKGFVQTNCVEIMQYTGLHDRNGVEIYEGDWVRQQFVGGDGQNEVLLDDMIFEGIVLWDYSGWGIDSMGDGRAEVGIVNNSILEVLGNKFENPELKGA